MRLNMDLLDELKAARDAALQRRADGNDRDVRAWAAAIAIVERHVLPTEPHWPTPPVGTSDELDGGRDDSAPGEAPQFPESGDPVANRIAAAQDAYLARLLFAPDNYWPGQYESPRTAPFVQVVTGDSIVEGHIVYPWPDGNLRVIPA